MTEIEMDNSGQATFTNKAYGARDRANSDLIELVHPNNVGNKDNIIICLAALMTEILRWIGQRSGQSTLTSKVNGACDKTNFDFIELVSLKGFWKHMISNLSIGCMCQLLLYR